MVVVPCGYPHPPEVVWRTLTDSAALGEWLMETDFVPEVGRPFTMWCDGGEGAQVNRDRQCRCETEAFLRASMRDQRVRNRHFALC